MMLYVGSPCTSSRFGLLQGFWHQVMFALLHCDMRSYVRFKLPFIMLTTTFQHDSKAKNYPFDYPLNHI